MSELAAIAMGSNLDSEDGRDRRGNLLEAVERVRGLGEVVVSSFYDTAPVGYVEQPRFLNGALLLETELEPVELLRELLAIERSMGRVRGVDKGPRMIDLDLLLYGQAVLETAMRYERAADMRRAVLRMPLGETDGVDVADELARDRGDER